MKLIFYSVVVAAILTPTLASAQCESGGGINTGGGNCTPPTAPGMPGYANSASVTSSSQTRVKWAEQWGAIVIDETTGDTGTIKGRASKSEAVRDATRDCEMYGATHCELMVAYYNQCAAIATTHHRFSWGRAGTEEQAKQEAVRSCETDSSQCEVAYSACSLPKRID